MTFIIKIKFCILWVWLVQIYQKSLVVDDWEKEMFFYPARIPEYLCVIKNTSKARVMGT